MSRGHPFGAPSHSIAVAPRCSPRARSCSVSREDKRAARKAALCRVIAALPGVCWPVASSIVRTLWPGFRDA